jgi:S-adenosylmethionine synthetase
MVHHGLADRVLVQVAYSIGIAEPLSIHVQSYGTVKNGLTDHQLKLIIKKNFDFRPFNIIKELDLLRPIYRATAQNGHFGSKNPDFSWEKPKAKLDIDV